MTCHNALHQIVVIVPTRLHITFDQKSVCGIPAWQLEMVDCVYVPDTFPVS